MSSAAGRDRGQPVGADQSRSGPGGGEEESRGAGEGVPEEEGGGEGGGAEEICERVSLNFHLLQQVRYSLFVRFQQNEHKNTETFFFFSGEL